MKFERLEQLLQTSAAAHPDAVAFADGFGKSITYGQMQTAVDAGAGRLREMGVRPGDRVGLCLPKTVDTLVLVYSILRAEAAYVPVDMSAPARRSATVFSDCGVRALFCADDTASPIADALVDAGHAMKDAGEVMGWGRCLLARSIPEPADNSLAYILYTSGSTGRPKGVAHTHASALAFVNWCSNTFKPGPHDRFSSHAPLHFDLSILDIYLPIMHGGYVRLLSADESRQPAKLTAIAADDSLTFWYSTPSILKAMLEFGQMDGHDHSALRIVCFAGEVFPPKHLRNLAGKWPQARFFNLYGPTETNVCTAYELTDPQAQDDNLSIPIGFAASGDETLIVDETGSPVSPDELGELVINGPSVMLGYWNDPAKTSASMLHHDGRDWYRTGDIVETREDGALIYRGRRDRMVKRRGYRIELGEVEAALLQHPDIDSGAVVPVETSPGEISIVAFHTWTAEAPPSLIAMKRHSSQTLPSYMIPDRFARLDALPYTSTDKIDYQKLKEMAAGLLTDR